MFSIVFICPHRYIMVHHGTSNDIKCIRTYLHVLAACTCIILHHEEAMQGSSFWGLDYMWYPHMSRHSRNPCTSKIQQTSANKTHKNTSKHSQNCSNVYICLPPTSSYFQNLPNIQILNFLHLFTSLYQDSSFQNPAQIPQCRW